MNPLSLLPLEIFFPVAIGTRTINTPIEVLEAIKALSPIRGVCRALNDKVNACWLMLAERQDWKPFDEKNTNPLQFLKVNFSAYVKIDLNKWKNDVPDILCEMVELNENQHYQIVSSRENLELWKLSSSGKTLTCQNLITQEITKHVLSQKINPIDKLSIASSATWIAACNLSKDYNHFITIFDKATNALCHTIRHTHEDITRIVSDDQFLYVMNPTTLRRYDSTNWNKPPEKLDLPPCEGHFKHLLVHQEYLFLERDHFYVISKAKAFTKTEPFAQFSSQQYLCVNSNEKDLWAIKSTEGENPNIELYQLCIKEGELIPKKIQTLSVKPKDFFDFQIIFDKLFISQMCGVETLISCYDLRSGTLLKTIRQTQPRLQLYFYDTLHLLKGLVVSTAERVHLLYEASHTKRNVSMLTLDYKVKN